MVLKVLKGSKDIDEAARLLKEGKIVAFPTETVYGLGAVVFSIDSVKKIFSLKGRPADNPLIVHIADIVDVDLLAKDLPEDFFLLAEAFFPGPLTVLLPKHHSVPAIVTGGHSSVAVRMPNYAMTLSLIKAVGAPIVGPSANRSGKPSSTSIDHIIHDFPKGLDAILEGEQACSIGIESTVLSLLNDCPMICRPGVVTSEEIEEVLGKKINDKSKDAQMVASPGSRYRHYAPTARIHLCSSEENAQKYIEQSPKIYRAIIKNPHAYNFYRALREADKLDVQEIIIIYNRELDNNPALWDRIFRASLS
ncbi:L-threonylcarbamoyladenylate synthase [Candidatus Clavichlamydia salmonicola]|uniref:L-threonylcarbamoyladenylate synthase n=1 Tax=Candidatus Clavichlamydia salmonicola TaxID=469812 RepID=UPI00189147E9|nr:L-threonylcarbamoyladenylate synthase [Candidatus Clavichlamydia salmonicola]